MKKLLVILMVALMASAAVAQDTGTDSFGLYFDPAFTTNTTTVAAGTNFNMYMAIAGPTVRGCATLEVQLAVVPGDAYVFVNGTVWNGTEGIDVDGTTWGFIVGFGTPMMAVDNNIYVGYLVLSTFSPSFTFLAGPVSQPSIPNEACYVDPDDFGNLVVLEFATDEDGMGRGANGWLLPGYELAAVNTNAAVSAEDATWSEVKGMFR
ncbi:MAG: hypothetical protein R6X25_11535 [Candidatus Krumholzibacteriia bacterium]